MRRFERSLHLLWAVCITVCLACALTLTAHAAEVVDSGTCGANGDNVTWTLYDNDELVITGTGAMADDAYLPSYSAAKVTIGDGVTSIGNYAFSYCPSLTSVTIPNSVTYIGEGAFYDCDSLTYNAYGNAQYLGNAKNPYLVLKKAANTSITSCTIHSDARFVLDEAFQDCSSLTYVNIPNSVTSIGRWAFCNCFSMTSVALGSGVATIGEEAFASCGDLTSITVAAANPNYKSEGGVLLTKDGKTLIRYPSGKNGAFYAVPAGVTAISAYAFDNCYWLTTITIPGSVTSIGNAAFIACFSLTSITVAADNPSYKSVDGVLLTKDGKTLILYPEGKSGTSYTIPNGVTTIGDEAFWYCEKLTSIVIPDSVTSIGDSAFTSCTALTAVTIGSGVTSIGDSAFSGCTALAAVTIGSGVTSIGFYAFGYCTALTSIVIPYSVNFIDQGMFYGCTALTSIVIPISVTSISWNAFKNCTKLTDVHYAGTQARWNAITIENGNDCLTGATLHLSSSGGSGPAVVDSGECGASGSDLTWMLYSNGELVITGTGNMEDNSIPWYSNRDSITKVMISDGVTSIGSYAFYNCSSLTSVTIGSGVTSIGGHAFSYCTSLTSITIPSGVISIGEPAFYYCTSLTSVTIPDSVSSISRFAFQYCSSLTSIDVAAGNQNYKSINGVLFSKDGKTLIICPGGKVGSYTVPSGVTAIGDSAFEDCSSLTSITIPSGVTSIGDWAFGGCSSLTDVYYTGTQTQWDAISIGTKNDPLLSATLNVNYVPPAHVPGDMDGNDEVNMTDAVMLLRYLAGGYGVELDETVADLDHSDSVNMTDAVMLLRYLAGGYGVELG